VFEMYSDYQVIQAHTWFNSERAVTQRKVIAADKVAHRQRICDAKRIAMMIVRGTAPSEYSIGAGNHRLMSVDGFMSMMNAPSRR
jgi:hypothetical protein